MRLSVFAVAALLAVSGCAGTPTKGTFEANKIASGDVVVFHKGNSLRKLDIYARGEKVCTLSGDTFAHLDGTKAGNPLSFTRWDDVGETTYTIQRNGESPHFLVVGYNKELALMSGFGLLGAAVIANESIANNGPYSVVNLSEDDAKLLLVGKRESVCDSESEVQ